VGQIILRGVVVHAQQMDHDERLRGQRLCLEYVPPRGDDISEMGEMENGIPVSVRYKYLPEESQANRKDRE